MKKTDPAPPAAPSRPKRLIAHGHERIDEFYWMRERENPEVMRYLQAENAFTERAMRDVAPLVETLYEEIKGRIKQTDMTVPYFLNGFHYYTRYEEERAYPIFCRRRGSMEAPEEVMLDVNELAEGHEFYSVGRRSVTEDGRVLAFAADTVGRRIHTILFKDLESGALLEDRLPDCAANFAWANDGRTLFYTRQDPETLRWNRIYRHLLGSDPEADELVYAEDDETFSTFVFKTKSRRFLMIGSTQTLSSEYRYLEADDPSGEFRLVLPRERKHEYDVDHLGDHFYLRTNDAAENFRLVRAPIGDARRERWEEVVPHRTDIFLDGFELFEQHLVTAERAGGLLQMRIRPFSGDGEHLLDFGEPAYTAYFHQNPNIDTHLLRYGYTSLTTPNSVFDYDMRTREKKLLKQEEVLGGFDKNDYVTERLHAEASDGARVPISLVYRRDKKQKEGNPLLLYGYGAYGISIDPIFRPSRISLLDRGFAFAIAHVRGGQELGRRWYEDGKLLKKRNTFTDFIACAEHLIAEGHADPNRLFMQGGSAGGLLVGAVLNMRGELFRGAIAAVPFVDVVTTMLDESIPLTTGEYDEWGDPRDETYYRYMLSYSPYDNVEAKDYPALLVLSGLHDSQVQYWEPTKWVAKLRKLKTDRNTLLLKTKMHAGHTGASGRYEQYRDIAFEFAFLLKEARLAGGDAEEGS